VLPGLLIGWVPKGNMGRAHVLALKSLPLLLELRPLLADFNVWRDVAKGVVLYAIAAWTLSRYLS
jgi:hypothetical protein